MAFHEVRLPARLAFGSTGGVERRTEIITLGSGFERRSTPWAQGRRRYLIGANLRSLDDMAALSVLSWLSPTPTIASNIAARTAKVAPSFILIVARMEIVPLGNEISGWSGPRGLRGVRRGWRCRE